MELGAVQGRPWDEGLLLEQELKKSLGDVGKGPTKYQNNARPCMISRHDLGIGCIGKWKDKKEKGKKKKKKENSGQLQGGMTGQHYQSNRKDTSSKFGEANRLDKNRVIACFNQDFLIEKT